MSTSLRYIHHTQIDETTLQNFYHNFSVGPLAIDYRIDVAVLQITAQIYLLGVRIGSETIDVQNTSVEIEGSITDFKAQVILTASFPLKTLNYDIKISTPHIECKDYSGILFSW
jgi:hypothetical protein